MLLTRCTVTCDWKSNCTCNTVCTSYSDMNIYTYIF